MTSSFEVRTLSNSLDARASAGSPSFGAGESVMHRYISHTLLVRTFAEQK